MSISGEVAASIENSTSAADSNGDRRSALLTRATRIILASRAATTAWWMRRWLRCKHRQWRGLRPGDAKRYYEYVVGAAAHQQDGSAMITFLVA